MPAPNPVRELIRRELLDNVPGGSYQERYELFDPFLVTPTDSDFWSLGGTDSGSGSDASNHAGGGIVLTTGDSENDQRILSPANALTTTRWDAQHETRLELLLDIADITNVLVKAGLALTNALDRTTDDDQAGFIFDTGGSTSTSNWTVAESIDGDDTEADTGEAAAADETVRLGVFISSARTPRYYINGVKVHTGSPLTADAEIKPFVGIQTLSGNGRSLRLRGMRASRVLV